MILSLQSSVFVKQDVILSNSGESWLVKQNLQVAVFMSSQSYKVSLVVSCLKA